MSPWHNIYFLLYFNYYYTGASNLLVDHNLVDIFQDHAFPAKSCVWIMLGIITFCKWVMIAAPKKAIVAEL